MRAHPFAGPPTSPGPGIFERLFPGIRPGSPERLAHSLLEACSRGRQAQAIALLGLGARPLAKGPFGSTCLMFAARLDLPDLFLALCSHPECDTRARDSRGRDALFWASSRLAFLGPRKPSDLFSRLDDSLFDMGLLDAQGRHACQAALEAKDEGACIFWMGRAPEPQVKKALDQMDSFARARGAHAQAVEWLARSQAQALRRHIDAHALPARAKSSSPRL